MFVMSNGHTTLSTHELTRGFLYTPPPPISGQAIKIKRLYISIYNYMMLLILATFLI